MFIRYILLCLITEQKALYTDAWEVPQRLDPNAVAPAKVVGSTASGKGTVDGVEWWAILLIILAVLLAAAGCAYLTILCCRHKSKIAVKIAEYKHKYDNYTLIGGRGGAGAARDGVDVVDGGMMEDGDHETDSKFSKVPASSYDTFTEDVAEPDPAFANRRVSL